MILEFIINGFFGAILIVGSVAFIVGVKTIANFLWNWFLDDLKNAYVFVERGDSYDTLRKRSENTFFSIKPLEDRIQRLENHFQHNDKKCSKD